VHAFLEPSISHRLYLKSPTCRHQFKRACVFQRDLMCNVGKPFHMLPQPLPRLMHLAPSHLLAQPLSARRTSPVVHRPRLVRACRPTMAAAGKMEISRIECGARLSEAVVLRGNAGIVHLAGQVRSQLNFGIKCGMAQLHCYCFTQQSCRSLLRHSPTYPACILVTDNVSTAACSSWY
jgi:hypothetical protein